MVYNSAGELIRMLATDGSRGGFSIGEVRWDGTNDRGDRVAAGLYLIYAQGSKAYYRKIIIVR